MDRGWACRRASPDTRLFPCFDIALASVANSTALLVRKFARLHRLDDMLPAHTLLLAYLLDGEPATHGDPPIRHARAGHKPRRNTEHDPHWAKRSVGLSRYPVMTFHQNKQAGSQSQALLLHLLRRTSHIVTKVDVLVDTVREQCELG